MPELAEVELARRIWSAGIVDGVMTVETHPRTRIFRNSPAGKVASALTGSTLSDSRAHGKRLLFTFTRPDGSPAGPYDLGGAVHLELHLGMAGRLFSAAPSYGTQKHDHLVLRLENASLVYSDYRQFGRVDLLAGADPWAELPPQPLDRAFTLRHVEGIVDRHPNRNLKALLLDQGLFPGVGNWMADEICWRLGVYPGTPARHLDPATLRRVARRICRGAIRHVADRNESRAGDEGFAPGSYVAEVPPSNWLFQHRWKPGGTCPSCKSGLSRGTIGSRTTAWCPACQPLRTASQA